MQGKKYSIMKLT